MRKFYWNKRIMHRYLAYAVMIPLTMTAVTGFLYKILLDVIGVQKEKIKFLLKLHQMSILFPNSAVFYTTLLTTIVTALVVFGYSMIYNPLWSRSSRSGRNNRFVPQSMREYHHRYSSVIFIILLFMTLSGGVYRFLRAVVGIEKEDIHWLLELHHMGFLPNWLSVIWVTFAFLCIFSLLVSGGRILPLINSLFRPSKYQVLASGTSTPPTPSANDISIIVASGGSSSGGSGNIDTLGNHDINEIDVEEETYPINSAYNNNSNNNNHSILNTSPTDIDYQHYNSSSSSLSPRDNDLKDSF
ncbi:hypothetical protein CYY_003450 [Polysphondylium violaceum]|uniref:Uncharacterized protein n=1 Tax=Polysphondylium violaceum TaxID=133409 RepID=A0A8J4PWT3_9MYCE|nr:hypothetical protein CYY_003450 [Polysphondylium violaceum]